MLRTLPCYGERRRVPFCLKTKRKNWENAKTFLTNMRSSHTCHLWRYCSTSFGSINFSEYDFPFSVVAFYSKLYKNHRRKLRYCQLNKAVINPSRPDGHFSNIKPWLNVSILLYIGQNNVRMFTQAFILPTRDDLIQHRCSSGQWHTN